MSKNIILSIIGIILLIFIPIGEIYMENFMAYSAVDQINNVDDSRWLLEYNDYLPTVFMVMRIIGFFLLTVPLHKTFKNIFNKFGGLNN